ncbi:MAG TPA: thioesterase family protein [bacterium]|nr:thioesterase family protein [bacterium]
MSELEIRVRYAETDQMRVAHHAGYLVWFEAGRTEYIRACGRSYAQLEEDGWLLVVIEAHCRYRQPARYDDVLTVRTRLRELGPARLSFGYELVRAADRVVLADGWTEHAAVDRTGRARRLPESLRRLLGERAEDAHAPEAPREGGRDRAGAMSGPEKQ